VNDNVYSAVPTNSSIYIIQLVNDRIESRVYLQVDASMECH
jgi:hypothetical protein